MRCCSLQCSDTDDVPPIMFTDCLLDLLSPVRSTHGVVHHLDLLSIPQSACTVLPLDSLRYDLLFQKENWYQPSSSVLLQAVTRRCLDKRCDMENLEILGDCFLKLAMSLILFHQHPTGGAGILTSKKDKQVSNANLRQLAMQKGLERYLNAHVPVYSGKKANWIPPSYRIDEQHAEEYLKLRVKPKAIADMVEALIGCYLVSTDYKTTMQFMDWVGLKVIPEMNSSETVEERPALGKFSNVIDETTQTPPVLRPYPPDRERDVVRQVNEFFDRRAFSDIERILKYTFKNKAFLIAAFTHPSYIDNFLTICYERYIPSVPDGR